MSKRILITGGCGFVGSNLAIMLQQQYTGYTVIALDNLKRRGSELNIPRLREAGVQFIHGDIRNKEDFEEVGNIDVLIEAAAEPSVMAGLNGSTDYVINTNLSGTVNCLNYALKNKADFIFLSTSRVYPIKHIETINYTEDATRFSITAQQSLPGLSEKGIGEFFPLNAPRSLYGATKLASELMVQEYQDMLGLKTVINRCGVITGPWQMGKADQGVVVLWLARHYWKKQLSYIGYGGIGKQVRDILHIADLYRLVDWQLHNMNNVNGEIFNVGGGLNSSVSLLELTALCSEITGNKIDIASVPETRQADVRMYITDNSRITAATGWAPQFGAKDIIADIYDWLKKEEKILYPILNS